MVAALTPRSSRNSAGGHAYLADGLAHDGSNQPRNHFADGLGCMPETAEKEWQAVRQKFGKDGHRRVVDELGVRTEGTHVQAVHTALSYDKIEYNPSDPKAIERAHQQSVRTAERLRNGHQCVVKTQTDGRTGHIHSHLLFNAVHPETGRSMNGRHPAKDIQKLHATVDAVAKEHGFDNEKLMEERQQLVKLSTVEHTARTEGTYTWKVDLAQRLDTALADSTSREGWKEKAAESGVDVVFSGKGARFGFTDADGERRDIRASALGARWRSKSIDQQLDLNRERSAMQAVENSWDFDVIEVPDNTKEKDHDHRNQTHESGRSAGQSDRGGSESAGRRFAAVGAVDVPAGRRRGPSGRADQGRERTDRSADRDGQERQQPARDAGADAAANGQHHARVRAVARKAQRDREDAGRASREHQRARLERSHRSRQQGSSGLGYGG